MNDTLEIVDLEKLFEDELHCQVEHHPKLPSCSIEVAYVGNDCQVTLLLCKNYVEGVEGFWDQVEAGHLCSKCNRTAKVCWRVVPV